MMKLRQFKRSYLRFQLRCCRDTRIFLFHSYVSMHVLINKCFQLKLAYQFQLLILFHFSLN